MANDCDLLRRGPDDEFGMGLGRGEDIQEIEPLSVEHRLHFIISGEVKSSCAGEITIATISTMRTCLQAAI